MSKNTHEQLTHIDVGGEELFDSSEHLKGIEEKLEQEARQDHERHSAKKTEVMETAREQITDVAEEADRALRELDQPTAEAHKPVFDRKASYKETIKRVQSQEAPLQRTFSKVIHAKAVDVTSEALERSVGRASVIAGMFIISFMGTLVLYVLARQNGYAMDVLSYIPVFMVAGGVIGVCLELGATLYRRLKLR